MIVPRHNHGLCSLMNVIYAVGGQVSSSQITNRCERFDITKNAWEEIPSLPQERMSPSLVGRDRFVYSFGGLTIDPSESLKPAIFCIDTSNLEKGWHRFHVESLY